MLMSYKSKLAFFCMAATQITFESFIVQTKALCMRITCCNNHIIRYNPNYDDDYNDSLLIKVLLIKLRAFV